MTDLNQYLTANGYATLEDWGRDSDYRQTPDGLWVDEDGYAVDLYAQWSAAMESLENGPSTHGTYKGDIRVSDYETLDVIVTEEGVIFDAYDTDGLVATMGMTFAEWFTFVTRMGMTFAEWFTLITKEQS